MTNKELDFLRQMLADSRCYLEFGAGNSTKLAVASANLVRIDSVESSREFIEKRVLDSDEMTQAVESKRLRMHWVDIGPTWHRGEPRDFSRRPQWPNYSSRIFREYGEWDLILIDGRFRIACCLNALTHMGTDCRILIHDFWNRPHYHLLLEFLEPAIRVDTLGLFHPKKKLDLRKIKRLIEKYQYMPNDATIFQRVWARIYRPV